MDSITKNKIDLSELTIELGEVTGKKWRLLNLMKDVLAREEGLLKQIGASTRNIKREEDEAEK